MKLIEYLPEMYKDVLEVKEIMKVETIEITTYKELLSEIEAQMFIDTATWGLSLWEKSLSIEYNPELSYMERQGKIKSKLFGVGKVDDVLIRSIADSWTNGDVIVSMNSGNVGIEFTSYLGMPSNMDELRKTLRNMVPAHLKIMYKYASLLIRDIEGKMTLGELENTPLHKFTGGEEEWVQ
ncbi:DUF2313 domain-containing protein [Clostridiaceae bacterium M8S5]|nr:DUF2313 domain-containing protein [Clostridiaceae bacterium M8S5]